MISISEHISYREATFSQTAIRKGIVNIPNDAQLEAMKLLAINVFEPLREGLNFRPIFICSFFRCLELNREVGSIDTSQHIALRGAAMDVDNDNSSIGPTNKEIFDYIRNNLLFDQLIWEYGDNDSPAWVHVSYREGDNRKQVIRCVNGHYYYI